MRIGAPVWCSVFALLLCGAGTPADVPGAPVLQIDGAYHLVGLGDIPQGTRGNLYIRDGGIAFYSEHGSARIDRGEITAVYLDRDTRPLVEGAAGQVILFAPFGTGKAIGMIRPGIDVLTVISADANGGARDAVFFLPKGAGEEARALLEAGGHRNRALFSTNAIRDRAFVQGAGVQQTGVQQTGVQQTGVQQKGPPLSRQVANLSLTAIQVENVTGSEGSLPPAWRAALYEGVIRKLRESGRFQHVLRAGDRTAPRYADLALFRLDVRAFSRGNDRLRNLTAYAGATTIGARVQVTSRDGAVLADAGVNAKVQTFGESVDVTGRIVRNIGKAFGR